MLRYNEFASLDSWYDYILLMQGGDTSLDDFIYHVICPSCMLSQVRPVRFVFRAGYD